MEQDENDLAVRVCSFFAGSSLAWRVGVCSRETSQDTPIDPLDLYLARFTQFLLPEAWL